MNNNVALIIRGFNHPLHINLCSEYVFTVKTKQILQPREEKLGGRKVL